MGETIKCTINFTWDPEANVWIATSEDINGLVLESDSFDALMDKVKLAVPELLEESKRVVRFIDYSFVSERNDRVAVNG